MPADFEDGGRGHEPRNARNIVLDAGKDKERDCPLEPPEEAWYLDFGLTTSTLISAQ